MSTPTTLCLYHTNSGSPCIDGLGAAWAVYMIGEPVRFIPCIYGDPPPDVTGVDQLFIVDFSYPPDVLKKLLDDHPQMKVTLIDHHDTALRLLDFKHERLESLIDTNHSGAGLAWTHLLGYRPDVIRHIEDYDLWRFALNGTREIVTALYAAFDPDDIFSCLVNAFGNLDTLVEQGTVLLRQRAMIEKAIRANAVFRTLAVPTPVDAMYDAAFVNCPHEFASDVSVQLLEDNPNIHLVVAWFHRGDGNIKCSFRSRKGGVNVAAIVEAYGAGGGHVSAAGAVFPPEDFILEYL